MFLNESGFIFMYLVHFDIYIFLNMTLIFVPEYFLPLKKYAKMDRLEIFLAPGILKLLPPKFLKLVSETIVLCIDFCVLTFIHCAVFTRFHILLHEIFFHIFPYISLNKSPFRLKNWLILAHNAAKFDHKFT